MSQSFETRYRWETLPWKQIERKVFKLQRRIYRASRRHQHRLVHRLQRLLAHSWYARLLAVRRVTQDNQGKRTAGIDGVKSIAPHHRLHLAQTLIPFSRARPLRRIWIAKPGKTERRALSIPTLRDRATQGLIKLTLDPQWEAHLDPNMYGFRSGRSCQDAIEAVFKTIVRQPKYVLTVDIRGCFDNISHTAILSKSQTPPWMRQLLKGWLKCGVIDDGFHRSERGSPQGGVISPLLCLIALSGLEPAIKQLGTRDCPIYVIAYADDMVILTRQQSDIHRAKVALEQWLSEIGLSLHPDKTTLCHTLHGDDAGFDFLGYHVQQYPVGKYVSHRGYKSMITPSQAKVNRHLAHLKDVIQAHRGAAQSVLIRRLNPIIRGWCNYYRNVSASHTFGDISNTMFHRLLRWAKRRHSTLNNHQIVGRYWLVNTGVGWVFKAKGKDEPALYMHHQTRFCRHTKVQSHRSPYDGDWVYWGTRLRHYPGLSARTSYLLHRQNGKCLYCGLSFRLSDGMETHHRDGNHNHHHRQNLALLHRHCHDQIHAAASCSNATRAHDKGPVREEPDDAKGSRPVLKPSLGGDSQA